MKTADVLFDENKTRELDHSQRGYLDISSFKKALTEHDNEIKDLIDERVKQLHAEIRNHPDRKKGLVCKLSEIERFKRKLKNKGSVMEIDIKHLDQIYEDCEEQVIQGCEFYLRGLESGYEHRKLTIIDMIEAEIAKYPLLFQEAIQALTELKNKI